MSGLASPCSPWLSVGKDRQLCTWWREGLVCYKPGILERIAGLSFNQGRLSELERQEGSKDEHKRPEPRWVHSFTGGVSRARRAEGSKPIAKNQAHEALITPAANPSRPPAF
jgi:hypothetical protein